MTGLFLGPLLSQGYSLLRVTVDTCMRFAGRIDHTSRVAPTINMCNAVIINLPVLFLADDSDEGYHSFMAPVTRHALGLCDRCLMHRTLCTYPTSNLCCVQQALLPFHLLGRHPDHHHTQVIVTSHSITTMRARHRGRGMQCLKCVPFQLGPTCCIIQKCCSACS